MLDLPVLFTTDKQDITDEFSLFVHVKNENVMT